jgi:hypothetical protein
MDLAHDKNHLCGHLRNLIQSSMKANVNAWSFLNGIGTWIGT